MYTHLHTVSQTYWADNNLVEVRIPGTDDMTRFAVRSRPEEWTARAKGLFDHHQYQQAIHAFKRAHMEREVSVASAYQLRVQAQQATKNPTKAFLEAARAFFACGTITSKQGTSFLGNHHQHSKRQLDVATSLLLYTSKYHSTLRIITPKTNKSTTKRCRNSLPCRQRPGGQEAP